MRHVLTVLGLLLAGGSYVLVAVLVPAGMTSATWAFLGFALCIAGLGALVLARAWAQVLFLFGNLVAGLVAVHSLRVTWGELELFLPTFAVTVGIVWSGVAAVRWAESHDARFAYGTFGLPWAYGVASVATVAYFVLAFQSGFEFVVAASMGVVGFGLAAWGLWRVSGKRRRNGRRRPFR